MANIELRYLQYFVAVAEELNFGRAAERLNMAQPPLSRQISRLEKELGVELFQRTKRQVQLTEAGRVFLEEVRPILLQVEQSVRAAQRAARGEVGRLAVGFEGSFSYDIIPFSLREYQERFPNVNLIVYEMTTVEQGQALDDRRIGVGFVVPPLDNESLIFETVLRERLIVALPENHPLTNQQEVSLQALADEPFVTGPRDRGCGLYRQVVAICRQADFEPRIVQETNEIQMMLGFVAAGLGVSLLPSSTRYFQRPGVVYRELRSPVPEIELAMVWHANSLSPVLQTFLEVVRQFNRQDPHSQ
ncbi:MAG: LysR substrate-binding domain-containing protein [Hydrococcus sp. Prado102]|jgi:DNA-binding transcriptional LysR family regulator|nr:LysR substrate-binding domain-containing protein [Hydrococcus sp. Prado102]